MNSPLLAHSDKHFWHRFAAVYETQLKALTNVTSVLDFGVFRGNSIRWLSEKYPDARIYGCDILAPQPEWPVSEAIQYFQVDQASPDQLRRLFDYIGVDLDLIIEDGSHLPLHQKNCLIEGIKHLRQDGVYIVEDIHTSHPEHQYYTAGGPGFYIGPLHLLLAIEHLKAIEADLDDSTLDKLSSNSIFTREEVRRFGVRQTCRYPDLQTSDLAPQVLPLWKF